MPALTDTPKPKPIEQFRSLQTQLRHRWQLNQDSEPSDYDILVIPSITLDQRELQKIKGIHHYEERLLFSLIRLRNPRTRLIYVTSQPLHPSIVDYYLQLLPGIPFSHARSRLLLLSTYDASCRSLTEKILERPRLLERIRQSLRLDRAYMTCFNSTSLERELSVQLGLPLLALDPELLYWGTKSGSRQIFAECDIPHPDGSPLVWSIADLAMAAAELWERQPHLQRIVIKLNQGFSGEGNAILDLDPLQDVAPRSGASLAHRADAIAHQFPGLRFQAAHEVWENFSSRIPELGAIAEAFIEGAEKRSPSVQVSITPGNHVEVLSTHDQILGGPDQQIFLGCRFPADQDYRLQLQDWGEKIGRNLADKGALDRLSVDFVAVKQPEGSDPPWDLQAIEINLRKGGTTHPFMALKLLTNGCYNHTDGVFYSRQGLPKYYLASDNLESQSYRGLLPNDLMDIIAYHHLNFNTTTETGTVFHLMGCLSEFGKLGLTSIGNTPQQAEDLYQQAIQALDLETSSLESGCPSFPVPPIHWTWQT